VPASASGAGATHCAPSPWGGPQPRYGSPSLAADGATAVLMIRRIITVTIRCAALLLGCDAIAISSASLASYLSFKSLMTRCSSLVIICKIKFPQFVLFTVVASAARWWRRPWPAPSFALAGSNAPATLRRPWLVPDLSISVVAAFIGSNGLLLVTRRKNIRCRYCDVVSAYDGE
jgi:hypothetical protein